MKIESRATVNPYDRAVGALSRLSPESVLRALRIPSTGSIYDLGMEINERMPQGEAFVPYSIAFNHTPEGTGAKGPFQFATEVIVTALHYSTHIDALVHVQAENKVYGGRQVREIWDDSGWKELGIESVPPIIGRCVLLDVAGHKGLEMLPDRYEITTADLEAICKDRSIALESGDIVLVRTGKIREFWSDPAAFGASQPGVGIPAAIWLHDKGMAMLGTDTTGTEPLPFDDPAMTTHRALLVERGVHLIENLYLDELAANAVSEALFVCLPLKITGATGSFVRPIALA